MKAHARAVLEVLEQYENGRVRTKDYGARKANGVRDYIAHVKAAGFELRAWMRRKIAELETAGTTTTSSRSSTPRPCGAQIWSKRSRRDQ